MRRCFLGGVTTKVVKQPDNAKPYVVKFRRKPLPRYITTPNMVIKIIYGSVFVKKNDWGLC